MFQSIGQEARLGARKSVYYLMYYLLLPMALLGCSGGGGGGGSGGAVDYIPPQITGLSPSDNATLIDPDVTVTVVFNELINNSSITANSFVLRDQSNRQVSGEIKIGHTSSSILGDKTFIDFVPDARLQDSTQYHVLVDTGIKDKAGNHLSDETTWTFTTAPGGSGTWVATSSTNAPDRREGHTAIWTGTEMIIWGGEDVSTAKKLDDGARYNPMTDTWSAISTQGAPSPRWFHTAIWTGTEMIIWGGWNLNGFLNDGARYNPATDTWQSISLQGAPSARREHSAVWTGSEMLIWGGRRSNYTYPLDGGRYNPTSDTWQLMSTVNVPTERAGHGAVWTGAEMIVWGGRNDQSSTFFSSGGRYDPNADSWVSTSSQNAPSSRAGQSAVWTGNDMIVWGGYDGQQYLDSGGKYNPVSDSWVMTSLSSTPPARGGHSAVWTGAEMIVWGGKTNHDKSRIGGLYDPINDTWFYTTTLDSPDGRDLHTAIWTGNQMVVWGGAPYGLLNVVPNDGGLYTP